MNKIVRTHYPVDKLPEDLRRLVPGVSAVTVEIVPENRGPKPLSRDEAVAMMRQMQKENAEKGTAISMEEAVARVRALRDEWDD